jgi:hypothetical protein
MSTHDGRSQKVSWAAKVLLYSVSRAAKGALYFEGIYCSVTPVSQPLSQHFLNYLTSVLSLLSQISLSHVSTWWQKPKSVLSRKGITLLWRHLLQCHTCILTSFSTLSQLSNICTVSPFSNFAVSCLHMMAEAKKCHEPQKEHSTLKTSTAVTDLSPNIFLNTFSTVSCL